MEVITEEAEVLDTIHSPFAGFMTYFWVIISKNGQKFSELEKCESQYESNFFRGKNTKLSVHNNVAVKKILFGGGGFDNFLDPLSSSAAMLNYWYLCAMTFMLTDSYHQ